MDILKSARDAIALIQSGRQALASVMDAVSDGRAALSAETIEDLHALVESERLETEQAYTNLKAAIAQSRRPA